MKHYHIQDFVLFFFCLRSLQLLCQVGIIPANNAVLYEPVTPFSYLLFFSFGMFDASWISHRDRSGKAVRDSHLAELILNCLLKLNLINVAQDEYRLDDLSKCFHSRIEIVLLGI